MRLTQEREAEIRGFFSGFNYRAEHVAINELLAELDATRAELAQLKEDAGNEYAIVCHFKEQLEAAAQERDRFKQDYESACHTVAKMHAAAVGEVCGPRMGVVEDIAQLKAERDEADRMLRHYHDVDHKLLIAPLEDQLQKSLAAQARLRGALEHITAGHGIKDCCVRAFHKDQLDNHDVEIASEALSSDDGSELLTAIRGVIKEMETIAEVEHDIYGAELCARRALDYLRKALGESV